MKCMYISFEVGPSQPKLNHSQLYTPLLYLDMTFNIYILKITIRETIRRRTKKVILSKEEEKKN